jgi:methylmalonyl-CoA/ethylmalonyl-CoA epimerase
MPEIKHIHHIAILVENLDTSLSFWQDILGLIPSKVTEIPEESARIAFFPLGESEVELVQPTSADSGLSRYLEKRGPGMHHLCLEVTDLSALLVHLRANGIQLINDEPKIGEGGKLYAFIHPKSANGVLMELYQLPG